MIIKEILSSNNDIIKLIKKLHVKAKIRYEEKLYIVEGFKQVQELAPERIHRLIISHPDRIRDLKLPDSVPVIQVSEKIYDEITVDPSPQGIMALVHMVDNKLDFDHFKENGLYLMLDTIQDPGNLGTIIRVADAVGIDGLIANKTTVDCYNPKVIKSTMGSLEHINYYIVDSLPEVIKAMQQRNIQVLGAYLDGSISHFEATYQNGCCVIIGNEGNGISQDIISITDQRIRIPMPGRSESLNAGVATSVILYEALRQRMQ